MATALLDQRSKPATSIATPSTAASRPSAWPRWALIGASLVGLIGYASVLWFHCSSGFGGSDSSGYANIARLLCEGKLTEAIPHVPEISGRQWLNCPLGFVPVEETGIMRPTYPVGVPLLLAISSALAGWHAGTLTLIVGGTLATLLCCYGICREFGVRPVWAILSTGMLALSPMLIWSSSQIMSDGPAATTCAVAFYAALRGRRSNLAAACCGAALGIAVLIRPTNLLMAPALIVVLGDWKKLLAWGLGGAPIAACLAFYNQFLWGAPWITGYGDHYRLFRSVYLPPTLFHYAKWLPNLLPIGVFGLLCLPFVGWRTNRRELIGLSLWALAYLTCYAFYSFTSQAWWYMRFVLPAFPALAVMGAMGLEQIAAWTDRKGRPLIAAVVGVAMALASFGLSVRDLQVLDVKAARVANDDYATITNWILKNVPENAVVTTVHMSGNMIYHHRVILRWDLVSPEEWQSILTAMRTSGRPLCFSDCDDQLDQALNSRTPGNWKKLVQIGGKSVWQYCFD